MEGRIMVNIIAIGRIGILGAGLGIGATLALGSAIAAADPTPDPSPVPQVGSGPPFGPAPDREVSQAFQDGLEASQGADVSLACTGLG